MKIGVFMSVGKRWLDCRCNVNQCIRIPVSWAKDIRIVVKEWGVSPVLTSIVHHHYSTLNYSRRYLSMITPYSPVVHCQTSIVFISHQAGNMVLDIVLCLFILICTYTEMLKWNTHHRCVANLFQYCRIRILGAQLNNRDIILRCTARKFENAVLI